MENVRSDYHHHLRRLYNLLMTRFSDEWRNVNVTFADIKVYIVSCVIQTRQRTTPPVSPHFVLTIEAASLLLSFLQLKYQGTSITPFQTNPIQTYLGVATLITYLFTYGVELSFSSNHQYNIVCSDVVRRCMAMSGSVSLASMASILLPTGVCPIVYMVCIVHSAGDLIYWAYRRSMMYIRQFLRFLNYRSSPRRPLLPR